VYVGNYAKSRIKCNVREQHAQRRQAATRADETHPKWEQTSAQMVSFYLVGHVIMQTCISRLKRDTQRCPAAAYGLYSLQTAGHAVVQLGFEVVSCQQLLPVFASSLPHTGLWQNMHMYMPTDMIVPRTCCTFTYGSSCRPCTPGPCNWSQCRLWRCSWALCRHLPCTRLPCTPLPYTLLPCSPSPSSSKQCARAGWSRTL